MAVTYRSYTNKAQPTTAPGWPGAVPRDGSTAGMALVMPRRCRRADVVGLMVTGATR
jgi:hypothetical protein